MKFIQAMWETGIALAPSLFLGLLAAGVLHVFVKRDRIFRHMGKPGFRSSLKASLIGVPLPLCSCGVLPAAIGLRKDGASKGAAVSFLTSTPQTGVDSIAATWALLGWPVAVAKVAAALIAGIASGTIVDALDKGNGHETAPESESSDEKGSIPLRIWRYSTDTLFRDIYLWLLIGVGISAIVVVFIEPGQLAEYPVLTGPWGMLAALAIGIPLYVCSVSSVPIAAALVYAGFPVGSALVFLMAGPATNAATMGAVRKYFGGLSFWSYIITVAAVSLLVGMVLNGMDIPVSTLQHHHTAVGIVGLLKRFAAGFFFAGIAFYAIKDIILKYRLMPEESEGKTFTYNVTAMSCSNCVRTVTEALSRLPGVGSVSVSLEEGTAVVVPAADYSNLEVLEALKRIGHKGELDEKYNGAACSCSTCNT